MREFKRENRYLVIKWSDATRALNSQESMVLGDISAKIEESRQAAGKPPMECVVVEADWPIYEQAWSLIESMSAGHSPDAGKMVPDGWQLVPVEPTSEMLLAAAGEVHSATYWGPAYQAMLAAAPKLGG